MAVELTLEQLKDLARSHWKKHLPKFYRNLENVGELEKRVENAARFTLQAFKDRRGGRRGKCNLM